MLLPINSYLNYVQVGWKLDNMEYERMVLFKDRSALFGRDHGEGYKPSW